MLLGKKQVTEMDEKVEKAVTDISDLIKLFGEDDSVKAPQFFSMFYNFAKEFSNCYNNIKLSEKVKEE